VYVVNMVVQRGGPFGKSNTYRSSER